MTMFRDLNKADEFKRVATHLFSSLSNEDELTQSKVEEALAQALGAGSIEGYCAHVQSQTMRVPINPIALFWEGLKRKWYVVTISFYPTLGEVKKLALHGKAVLLDSRCNDVDVSVCFLTGEQAKDREMNSSLFFAELSRELIVLSKQDAEKWIGALGDGASLPEALIKDTLSVTPLVEYMPELFELMMASVDELATLLGSAAHSSMVDSLGFTWEEYSSERQRGDTDLLHHEWVALRLESWRFDLWTRSSSTERNSALSE